MNNQTYNLSFVNCKNDSTIRLQKQFSWNETVELLSYHESTLDKDTTMVIFGPFTNDSRTAESFQQFDLLPLDYDGEETIETVCERFKEYDFVLYTSFNHKVKGNDRFRVVIRLESPIPANDIQLFKKSIIQWAGDVDRSCLYRSRGFYTPSCLKSNIQHSKVIVNEGKGLDWTTMFKREEIVQSYERSSEMQDDTKREMVEKLSQLYIGHEPEWVKVCWCMKGAGFSFEDFCEATLCGMMNSKTVNDCRVKWSSAKTGGGVGYLINLIRNKIDSNFMKSKVRIQRENITTEKNEIQKEVARLQKILETL